MAALGEITPVEEMLIARSFFIKRNMQLNPEPVTIEMLKEAFRNDTPEARQLLDSVVSWTGSIRGTKSYWGKKLQELLAVAHALRCHSAFITFSATDNLWQSLHQHMPRYEEWQAVDELQMVWLSVGNLRDNPHIGAYHFQRRMQLFTDMVLRKKINLREHWQRFEWQGRGSPEQSWALLAFWNTAARYEFRRDPPAVRSILGTSFPCCESRGWEATTPGEGNPLRAVPTDDQDLDFAASMSLSRAGQMS